ncbi:hypothetical protein C3Y98_04745 [Methylotenera oryzisoli]|uniref:Uncharacterized protein n=1 Tax=Methylotenera oryzisoli TaxID=2080758 RepID=A0A4Y9VQN1_9PROT|nr:hypothetical protein [Methylotenera oryzisoli]TFW71417.1 hypothetical protein C3Y98_04745 [Methylotenera oryzisoli]
MIGFLSGLSLQTKALIAIGLFLSGLASGWVVHGWKTDSSAAKSINNQIKTATALQNESKPIINKKINDLQKAEIVYRTIKEKIYEKNDTDICFDAESLSLWNSAIAGADSNRPEPAREAAENEAIVASVEEVLVNASDNFETCNKNIIKHNALIDKVESLDGKMCACSR